jgi:putative transposase
MPVKDAPIKAAIEKSIDGKKRGRKKVISMVQRTHSFSQSSIRRVYENNGWPLFHKPRKRRFNHPSNPIIRTLKPNEEWAMDFMIDSLENGRMIKSLNIIDHFNLECKGIHIHHSIPATKLIKILEQVIESYGKPKRIRTDNGPEFTSKLFQDWLHNNGIEWSKIQKGKPQQNAISERFNRTMRDELFDRNLFWNLEQANEMAEETRIEYNSARPHESLGNKTPLEYAA